MLKPGRDLDALIAEKVMGFKGNGFREYQSDERYRGDSKEELRYRDTEWEVDFTVPYYSTEIAAAWEVVEKLKDLGWNIALHNCDSWGVWISKNWIDDLVGVADVRANAAPHAICLAALKAVGVEI